MPLPPEESIRKDKVRTALVVGAQRPPGAFQVNRPCSCGKRILNPIPIDIQKNRGVPILILHNCPSCKSTRAIPWHMATEEIRKAATLAHEARNSQSEMTFR